jgi:hypothetical protein
LISVMTMSMLGRSVDTDVVIIDGITMGDGVVMGDCKLRGFIGCCDVDGWLGGTTVSGNVIRFNLVSLRFCEWLCGVVKVLQLEGVG